MALFTKEFNMDEVPVLPYSDIKAPHKLRKLLIERDEEIKQLKEKSLKQSLSEAMKENGSWMTRMKKDHEKQLRTQRHMVAMYTKENKELEKQLRVARLVNKKLNKQIRCPGCPLQLEDDEELREEIKASSYLK
tara:strand:+ start:198 stop:599 length:402 start_codon:yes stop_codon:yes gene_type:complete